MHKLFDLHLQECSQTITLATLLEQINLNTGLSINYKALFDTNTDYALSHPFLNKGDRTYGSWIRVNDNQAINIIRINTGGVIYSYLDFCVMKSAVDLGFKENNEYDIKQVPWYGKQWQEALALGYGYVFEFDKHLIEEDGILNADNFLI